MTYLTVRLAVRDRKGLKGGAGVNVIEFEQERFQIWLEAVGREVYQQYDRETLIRMFAQLLHAENVLKMLAVEDIIPFTNRQIQILKKNEHHFDFSFNSDLTEPVIPEHQNINTYDMTEMLDIIDPEVMGQIIEDMTFEPDDDDEDDEDMYCYPDIPLPKYSTSNTYHYEDDKALLRIYIAHQNV